MTDVVTVRGFVASEVKMTLTASGLPVANFRLGSTERRFDRAQNQWIDAATNWYSVSMFRSLAQNASASVSKGERVIVTGKLKLRQWSKEDGRRGIAPEIDADAVGHDLGWSTAKFRRAVQAVPVADLAAIELKSGVDAPSEAGQDGNDDGESPPEHELEQAAVADESGSAKVDALPFASVEGAPPF